MCDYEVATDVICCKVKAVLQIVYAIDQHVNPVNKLVLDGFKLVANLLFFCYLFENEQEGVAEIMFVSNSYGN